MCVGRVAEAAVPIEFVVSVQVESKEVVGSVDDDRMGCVFGGALFDRQLAA
jgi:hypothetical protein